MPSDLRCVKKWTDSSAIRIQPITDLSFCHARFRAFAESGTYRSYSWVLLLSVLLTVISTSLVCHSLGFFQYSWMQKNLVLFCLPNYLVINYVAKLFSLVNSWNVLNHGYCWTSCSWGYLLYVLLSPGCVYGLALSEETLWLLPHQYFVFPSTAKYDIALPYLWMCLHYAFSWCAMNLSVK